MFGKKGKAVPLQAWSGPEGSRKLRFPDFMTMAQDGGKVSLTHWPPIPPGNTPDTNFCWRLSQLQGLSATGRIMSLKNSNDTIGNITRDLPVCSVVSQTLRHRAYVCVCIYILVIPYMIHKSGRWPQNRTWQAGAWIQLIHRHRTKTDKNQTITSLRAKT
jgi:hypothetical protein